MSAYPAARPRLPGSGGRPSRYPDDGHTVAKSPPPSPPSFIPLHLRPSPRPEAAVHVWPAVLINGDGPTGPSRRTRHHAVACATRIPSSMPESSRVVSRHDSSSTTEPRRAASHALRAVALAGRAPFVFCGSSRHARPGSAASVLVVFAPPTVARPRSALHAFQRRSCDEPGVRLFGLRAVQPNIVGAVPAPLVSGREPPPCASPRHLSRERGGPGPAIAPSLLARNTHASGF